MNNIRYANGETVTDPSTGKKVVIATGADVQSFGLGMEMAIKLFCPEKLQRMLLPLGIYIDAEAIREQSLDADAKMRVEEG